MIVYPDGPIRGDFDLEEPGASVSFVNPFPDLRVAGRELATKLESYRDRDDTVVLALILGGVLVGHEVAIHLGLPLDFVILRRLLAPDGPGFPVCAVSVAGKLEIVGTLPLRPEVPVKGLDFFLTDALLKFEQRERACRGGRPPLDLENKTVLLVDCGMRSGSTMMTAIQGLRFLKPAKIVVASPVASLGAAAIVRPEADEFACLGYPRPFGNVGVWYKDFSRPDDEQISDLMS